MLRRPGKAQDHLDMVPDPETCTDAEAWAFFHTFHAYTYWGGLEEAFKASEEAGKWQEAWLAEQDPVPEHFRFPEPHMDNLRYWLMNPVEPQSQQGTHWDLHLTQVDGKYEGCPYTSG